MPRRSADRTPPSSRPRRVARDAERVAEATATTAVEHTSVGLRLPGNLAALVNPDVIARRESLVAARLQDAGAERVRRRRCAEIVAQHLIHTHA